MSEVPDFKQLMVHRLGFPLGPSDAHRVEALLVEIWNARGAADLALIDPLTAQWGDDNAYGSELLAARAKLRALNR